ncbi:MAG: hypothetical protein DCF19_18150 [Pseudanabaena frigida]|uniref:Uncharacterized protein n=1 Tax=Pseudanabaena frigida TaxID=945775 RepID=A0A2W4XT31_9CYAN|nr:MAG: hypothetical protein DCF19_18150 [Pseudanabaena frigida]
MNIFFKKYLCLGYFGIAIAMLPDIAQADNVYADLPTLNSIVFVSSRGTSGTAIPLTANTALVLTSVGNVNVKSNTYGGFKVEVESTNNGLLKHSSGAGMAYNLNYNSSDTGQITTKAVVEDNGALITDCADDTGCDRDVKISISQSEVVSKPAGLYSDTLTFTLTNK